MNFAHSKGLIAMDLKEKLNKVNENFIYNIVYLSIQGLLNTSIDPQKNFQLAKSNWCLGSI